MSNRSGYGKDQVAAIRASEVRWPRGLIALALSAVLVMASWSAARAATDPFPALALPGPMGYDPVVAALDRCNREGRNVMGAPSLATGVVQFCAEQRAVPARNPTLAARAQQCWSYTPQFTQPQVEANQLYEQARKEPGPVARQHIAQANSLISQSRAPLIAQAECINTLINADEQFAAQEKPPSQETPPEVPPAGGTGAGRPDPGVGPNGSPGPGKQTRPPPNESGPPNYGGRPPVVGPGANPCLPFGRGGYDYCQNPEGTRLPAGCVCAKLPPFQLHAEKGPATPPPAVQGDVQDQTYCADPSVASQQRQARKIAAGAHALAVNTVMGIGSFLEGSAKVIDDYAQLLAQPRGEPVNKMAKDFVQMGHAVAAFWSMKDPRKYEGLFTAARKAVTEFNRNPLYNSGQVAGNLLLGYASGGGCKLTGQAVTTLGERVAQAANALKGMQSVDRAAQGVLKAAGKRGLAGKSNGQGGGAANDRYGQNNGGNGGAPKGPEAAPPVNDQNLPTNCVMCSIAGAKREMGLGMPTASDIYIHPEGKVMQDQDVFKLFAENFADKPPAYLDAEQLKQFSQGVPFEFPSLDALSARLAGIARNGTAGPGVKPKVIILFTNQPFLSAANGTGKLNPKPRFPTSAKVPETPPGHVVVGIGDVDGLQMKDFQSDFHDTDWIEKMNMQTWHPTALPPKILVYPVQ